MAVRKILIFGDKNLEKVSRKIEKIDDEIIALIADLRDTLNNAGGVGLAAPQIGVLKKVIFINLMDDSGEIVLINPRIIKKSGRDKDSEGCLSYPGYEGIVERPKRVTVRGMDANGNEVEVKAEELLARVFCHEIDHLEGILYTQRAKKIYKIDSSNE
jgi:peptide deformylase